MNIKELNNDKEVFSLIDVNEELVIQEDEIENVKWCDFEEALNTLTFENRKVFQISYYINLLHKMP